MVGKALASGAGEVVIDLEDAVAPEAKADAREFVRTLRCDEPSTRIAVRVNPLRSPWGLRDLEAVAGSAAPISSIVLPKAETREDLAAVEQILDGLEAAGGAIAGLTIQALVETAAGVAGLGDLVSRPRRLEAVIIGYADLAASLGMPGDPGAAAWLPIQISVLTHARAAGVEAVDGPFLGVADDDRFRAAADQVVALGFDSKWAIHPRQIAYLNEVFSPSADAVQWAQKVIAALDAAHAAGSGAVAVDGELVDEAMAVAARRTLAEAGAVGDWSVGHPRR